MLAAGRIARISRPALCAQRNARRWARSAQLAASAMRQAMRIPLGALRLSRGQQCAQRIAHRWAHCASLAASNALSGSLTAGRIAPLSRPAMRSADRSPLGALRLSRAASNALSGSLTAGRIAPLSRPAMRSADCSPLGALRLSLQRYSPCGISAAWRIAVFAGFFASQPFRFEPYDLLTNIVKARRLSEARVEADSQEKRPGGSGSLLSYDTPEGAKQLSAHCLLLTVPTYVAADLLKPYSVSIPPALLQTCLGQLHPRTQGIVTPLGTG
ncbi:unnamed protein product [Closterium sp. Naga37s-1]|nr:unnamed protein product [Closterium sp. Naga37s-1]